MAARLWTGADKNRSGGRRHPSVRCSGRRAGGSARPGHPPGGRENARLLRLLELTPQQAHPPGPPRQRLLDDQIELMKEELMEDDSAGEGWHPPPPVDVGRPSPDDVWRLPADEAGRGGSPATCATTAGTGPTTGLPKRWPASAGTCLTATLMTSPTTCSCGRLALIREQRVDLVVVAFGRQWPLAHSGRLSAPGRRSGRGWWSRRRGRGARRRYASRHRR